MSNVDGEISLSRFTLTCQILIGAMVTGVTVFLVIVLFMSPPGEPAGGQMLAFDQGEWQRRPLSSAAIVFAAIGFLASFLVPYLIVGRSRRGIARGTWPPPSGVYRSGTPIIPATDASKLAIAYQTQLIIGAAINEGVTFFALIAYMVERQPIILGLAVLLILGLAARFPTLGRVTSWIESQQDLLLQDRHSIF